MFSTVRRRPWPAVVLVAVVAAGCGSGAEEPTTSFAASGSASEDAEAGGSRPAAFPGAAGVVAAIDGTTLQVQGMSGQVAVTYTDATAITAAVTGSAADVVAGVCVLVRSEDAGPESTEVVATSVAVSSPAADGSCGGGLGGGGLGGGGFDGGGELGGVRPTGPPPEGAPTERPSGDGAAFSLPTSGVVTSVTGESFTVEALRPRRESADAEPVAVTVTTTAATTWTTQAAAGPEALVVGGCVLAIGEADSTGAVTAASIAVSPAVDGSCGGLGD